MRFFFLSTSSFLRWFCLLSFGVGPSFPFPGALIDRDPGLFMPFMLNSFSVCSICAALTQDFLRTEALHSESLSYKRRKDSNRSYNDLLAGLAQLENG